MIFNPMVIPHDSSSTPAPTPVEPLDPVQVYKDTRPADWIPMPDPADNEMYLLFHIPDGLSSLLAFAVTCAGDYTVAIGTMEDGAFVQRSSTSLASGTKYEAELMADDYGDLTSDGMKQVMVKVSGTDILKWEPSVHSKKTSPANFHMWNIVEIVCRLPKASSVRCGSLTSTLSLKMLRYFKMVGENAITSMEVMFANCSALTSIPQLNTGKVTNMGYIFAGCYSLISIPKLDTKNVTRMTYMFSNCNVLTSIPQLDTGKVTSMVRMFSDCNALTSIPQLDTRNVTGMDYMFSNCRNLTSIPQMDTGKVTSMYATFDGCSSLTSIPQLDTGNVTSMNGMFSGCYSLALVPQMDTGNVTSMNRMFDNCRNLTSIQQMDTEKVTSMDYMFSGCRNLISIPQLDTRNVTRMIGMFSGCRDLISIPQLDTSNVTDMSRMFSDCSAFTSIPQLDTRNATNMDNIFLSCYSLASLNLTATVIGWAGYNISLKDCSLGHEAIVNFINSLPTITESKVIILTGNPGLAELTDAEKAIATGKNWTLTL